MGPTARPAARPTTRAFATVSALCALLAFAAPGSAQIRRSASQTLQTCGGETPPSKPGGGAWACSFDDEFDATTGDPSALKTSWWVPQLTATSGFTSGPDGSQACYVNTANNISVSNGTLHLTVRKERAPVTCGWFTTQYTSGMVSTYTNFNQTYGRFEVRALLPQTAAAGLQETLWLWPVNAANYGSTWPDSGEVDFSEFYSLYSSLDVPYIHYNYDPATVNSATSTNTVTTTCQIALSRYNTYAVVWSPGSFTITVNGRTCLVDNYVADSGLASPAPFDQPFFIILTQALGIGGNAFNPSTTPLPATTSVDYVRVWK